MMKPSDTFISSVCNSRKLKKKYLFGDNNSIIAFEMPQLAGIQSACENRIGIPENGMEPTG